MKPILILVGIVMMLAGLAMAGVGVLWSGAEGELSGPFSTSEFVRQTIAPAVSPILGTITSIIPRGILDFAFYGQFGFLPTIGAVGVLIFLSGGLVLRNLPKASSRAVIRKSKDKVKSEVMQAQKSAAEADADAIFAPAAEQSEDGAPAKKAAVKMPAGAAASGIFAGMDEEEKTTHLISLSHAGLDKEKCAALLKEFRPKLIEHMDICREDALSMLTRQLLEIEIVRRRRQQENITPDQFRTFDEKITQLDRQAICYRYLPANPDSAPAEARKYFGLVYDRFNYSAIQQKLKSDADDWREVSVRTAEQVLGEKAPPRAA